MRNTINNFSNFLDKINKQKGENINFKYKSLNVNMNKFNSGIWTRKQSEVRNDLHILKIPFQRQRNHNFSTVNTEVLKNLNKSNRVMTIFNSRR